MVRRIILAYMSLTRGERNGFFVLAILIMILLAGRILIPVLTERPIPDFKEAESAFLAFRSAMQEAEAGEELEQLSAKMESGKIFPPIHAAIQYFNFDPNHITYEELLKLGLSNRVARTLVKYYFDPIGAIEDVLANLIFLATKPFTLQRSWKSWNPYLNPAQKLSPRKTGWEWRILLPINLVWML